MEPSVGIDTWLKRSLQVALVVVLLSGSYAAYRVSMLIYRVQRSIDFVSAKVDRLDARLADFEMKANAVFKAAVVQNAKDALRDSSARLLHKFALRGASPDPSPQAPPER